MTAVFTEYCCRSGGSNLNAGTRTGDTTEPGTGTFKTYTGGTWVQATRTFTPAGGANPTMDGIAVGDFVSITTDAATGDTGYIARITTVGATTFVTDATAKSGTAPVDGAVNMTARIGGAWLGPNGTSSFPLNFIAAACKNVAGNPVRVNMKNDATYSVTAQVSITTTALSFVQGYTTAYGDGGRAVIDGGTSGASYVLFSIGLGASYVHVLDLEFRNNGATGSAAGVTLSSTALFERCVVHDVRGHGFTVGSSRRGSFRQCEAYNCNQSNTAATSGFHGTSDMMCVRCISHDNSGSNSRGFTTGTSGMFAECIADTNGGLGFYTTGAASPAMFANCDAYNNGGAGLEVSSGMAAAHNCNFVKNGTYGVNVSGTTTYASIKNCAFGAGTQANASGTTNVGPASSHLDESGSINYASNVTPWTDPANGDFRINLAAAKNAGRGAFLETATSYAGTVGYPDIGAAQH